MAMEESESSRKKIIKALEGKLPDNLLPEVAEKVKPLRDNVWSLLACLRQEQEEQD